MERIEEFTIGSKNFMYVDFSEITTNEIFNALLERARPITEKHPKGSLYKIINVENIRFDSGTKKSAINDVMLNGPYLKAEAIIGADGIRKMVLKTIMKLAGRTNYHFCSSRDEAIGGLLNQD